MFVVWTLSLPLNATDILKKHLVRQEPYGLYTFSTEEKWFREKKKGESKKESDFPLTLPPPLSLARRCHFFKVSPN
jgi:hypothetical protein